MKLLLKLKIRLYSLIALLLFGSRDSIVYRDECNNLFLTSLNISEHINYYDHEPKEEDFLWYYGFAKRIPGLFDKWYKRVFVITNEELFKYLED